MDVVYIVKPDERNEELRYSLRSLANLPHDRVWLAGGRPSWVAGVEHIPTVQVGTKYANALGNLVAACRNDYVSDTFVLFNDDFFVTAPLAHVPTLHRGPVVDALAQFRKRHPRGSAYIDAMQTTMEWLQRLGIPEPLDYALHVPMPIHRATMLEVLARAEGDGLDVARLHKRTAYGNLAGVGGEMAEDVKVYTSQAVPMPEPFVSTLDVIFHRGHIGRALRRMWADPGLYEKAAVGHGELQPA